VKLETGNAVELYGEATMYTTSEPCLSADVRQQLLQSLVYLPASVVGQPDVLAALKQKLQAENAFSWKDYAQQMAQVWYFPVSVY
jgi:hypothetical protein